MKGKRQIPGWAFLVLALVVALIAIIMIVAFHQRSDESHQAEMLLSRLKGESYHLDSLEFQFERKLDPKLLEEVQGVESQIAQTLDELTRLDPGEKRLQQLSKTQLEFETDMDEMFRLIAAGNLEKADTLDKERVNPSFNALSETIANTSAIYIERAQQADRASSIGTTFIVIVAGMIIGFLILQFRKIELRAELMAVEQKALRHSEVHYRTIIETAHDLIWTLNNESNLTFFNKQFEEISGYKVSEWVGKSFAPLIYPEDLPKVQVAHLKTLQGISQSYEARVYGKDGKISTLLVNAIPWYENNKIIGTVSFGRDITERKHAEEELKQSKEFSETVINSMNDAIAVVDVYDYRIINANQVFLNTYNLNKEDVKKRTCYEITITELSHVLLLMISVHS